jgi:ABC-type lipoprotein export system ATPase subunit
MKAAPLDSTITVASEYLFEAKSLKKEFDDGQVQALRGVDFQIGQGEFVAVIGPSGCGKTTLLQMLGALDRPSSGTLCYRGNSIADLADPAAYRAQEIGFIFQAFHLLPTFTAAENVQIPMFETNQSAVERKQRAIDLLQAVGLAKRLNLSPPCSRAERGNESPSPAASPMAPPSCLPTNQPATSTAKTRAGYSN